MEKENYDDAGENPEGICRTDQSRDSGKQNRADEIHAESALDEPEEEISLECDDQREQGIRQEHRAQSNRRRIQREQQPGNQPGIVRAEKPPRKIDGENNRRPEQTSHHDTECETAAAYGEQPGEPCRIQRGANLIERGDLIGGRSRRENCDAGRIAGAERAMFQNLLRGGKE